MIVTKLSKILLAILAVVSITAFKLNLDPEVQKQQTTQSQIKQLNDIYTKLRVHTGQPTVPLEVITSVVINAWTDGQKITVTTGILKSFDGDENKIAMVLAHEMAHVMLGHVTDNSGRFTTAQKEGQADKMGAFIMLEAGYDVCAGRKIFTDWMARGDGDFADPSIYESPHPSYGYRYYSIDMPWCS